jgi:hypothetical protein
MAKHSTASLARVALAAGLHLGCDAPVPDKTSYMFDVEPIVELEVSEKWLMNPRP